jgi:hypothetical protein
MFTLFWLAFRYIPTTFTRWSNESAKKDLYLKQKTTVFSVYIIRLAAILLSGIIFSLITLGGLAMFPDTHIITHHVVLRYIGLAFGFSLCWNGWIWFTHLGLLWLSTASVKEIKKLPLFKAGSPNLNKTPNRILQRRKELEIIASYDTLEKVFSDDKHVMRNFKIQVRNRVIKMQWEKVNKWFSHFRKNPPGAGSSPSPGTS